MQNKSELLNNGIELLKRFCARNNVGVPNLWFPTNDGDKTEDRYWHVNSCAFYRKEMTEYTAQQYFKGHYHIFIMVDKCARIGAVGRLWSYPGYIIDRTPYGVLQHELGHYFDDLVGASKSVTIRSNEEKPLTGYCPQDTYWSEWWAEMFRLFVTNPELLKLFRPKAYQYICDMGITPCETRGPFTVIKDAPLRTIAMAYKKCGLIQPC